MLPVKPKNIKLTLAYDGTDYLGWQKTGDGKSIEETLQKPIEKILQHSCYLQAASRTDAGVHASGQVVNFLTSSNTLKLSNFLFSLNSLLPKDISVLSVEEMPLDFHPSLNCHVKEYHYKIDTGPTQPPCNRFYAWHVPYQLDSTLMIQAASYFIGTHNFKAFCNVRKTDSYPHYLRRIDKLELIQTHPNHFIFHIAGNHFLFRMVRAIIGTLVDIGKKKIPADEIPVIIASQERSKAGITAPAHGLSLHKISY